jgi:hypothetical protein
VPRYTDIFKDDYLVPTVVDEVESDEMDCPAIEDGVDEGADTSGMDKKECPV